MENKVFEQQGEIKTNKGIVSFYRVTVFFRRDGRIRAIKFENEQGRDINAQVDPDNAIYPTDTLEQVLQIPWFEAEQPVGYGYFRTIKKEA